MPPVPEPLLALLAVAGGLGLAQRLAAALLRLLLRAAEATAAAELAEVSRRRGDLTTLAARSEEARVARRDRRRHALLVLLWLAWIALPLLAGWMPGGYALAAPLWLLPRPPLRPR